MQLRALKTRALWAPLLVGCALFVFSWPLALRTRSRPGSTLILSPDRIIEALRSGTEEEKKHIAETLRLFIPAGSRVNAAADIPCAEFDLLKLHYVNLSQRGRQAEIEMHSWRCWYGYLVVMAQDQAGQWRWLDTLAIPARYEQPAVSFHSLVRPEEKEIMVRGFEVVSGTGILESDLVVLKLLDGRLRVVLGAPEKIVFAVPVPGHKQHDNTDQEQASKFSIIQSKNLKGEFVTVIRERQVIRDHKTQVVRWREYAWNPALRVFQAGPTYGE